MFTGAHYHHLVLRVDIFLKTGFTEVVVRTFKTFVAHSFDGRGIATITVDVDVLRLDVGGLIFFISRLYIELPVGRARLLSGVHLRQHDLQISICADANEIVFLISPKDTILSRVIMVEGLLQP